jgi:hypothetical protein
VFTNVCTKNNLLLKVSIAQSIPEKYLSVMSCIGPNLYTQHSPGGGGGKAYNISLINPLNQMFGSRP